MNHNCYNQGVVWGGYPINLRDQENLVSRYIKSINNRFRVSHLSNKAIQKSFLLTSSQYNEGVSLDGLWSDHAKRMHGKIQEKHRLIEALSFLRLFLKKERAIVLTDEQCLVAWFLSHQLFINDYQSVNKTYSQFLAACINVWRGQKVHIVMASESLACNDFENIKECYQQLGIKAAVIESQMDFKGRQEAYKSQVVYVSAQQLLGDALSDFEYLNTVGVGAHFFLDRLSTENVTSKLLLSGLDSLIINDANLILLELATQAVFLEHEQEKNEIYSVLKVAIQIAEKLIIDEDYIVNQILKNYQLTEQGQKKCQYLSEGNSSFWCSENRRESIVYDALIVLNEYTLNCEYIIQDNQLQIIEENTYKNTYRSGLGIAPQSLEILLGIKEGLPEKKTRRVKSQISYQRFFSYYFKVSGFTYGGEAVNHEIRRSYDSHCYKVKEKREVNRNGLFTYFCKNIAEKTEKVEQLVELQFNVTKGQIITLRSNSILDSVLNMMKSINREVEIYDPTNKEITLEHCCLSILESNKILIVTGFVEFSSCLSIDLNNIDVYILEGYENFLVRRFWQQSNANITMISAYDDPIVKALVSQYLLNFYIRLKAIYFLETIANRLYFNTISKSYERYKYKQRQKVKRLDAQNRKFYAFLGTEKF